MKLISQSVNGEELPRGERALWLILRQNNVKGTNTNWKRGDRTQYFFANRFPSAIVSPGSSPSEIVSLIPVGKIALNAYLQ